MDKEKEKVLYILAIVLQAGIIIYFVLRSRMQQRSKAEAKEGAAADDSYESMRNTAISITPAQLKLNIPDSETLVYGLVMDCHVGDVIVTLTAYITGAANIYFSGGGGRTGGGKNPAVGEAAAELVTLAQNYVSRAIRVTTTELCDPGCVRFYMLTNHGVYAAQEQLIHIEDGSSAWILLFQKGNEVVSQMRSNSNGSVPH